MTKHKRLITVIVICGLFIVSILLIAPAFRPEHFGEHFGELSAEPLNAEGQKDDKKNPPTTKVNQQKIEAAIKKGTAFLSGNAWVTMDIVDYNSISHTMRMDELLLYTLIHAEAVRLSAHAEADEAVIDKLLARVLNNPLDHIYHVSLRAMALEHLNRVKYQEQIKECAQFLLDNQCENGQWGYGAPIKSDKPSTPKTTPKITSEDGKEPAEKTRPKKDKDNYSEKVTKITIKQRRSGPAVGDNSNSQYAALGLRACMQAGIEIPTENLSKAAKWWRDSQGKDGGWNYNGRGVVTTSETSYGSMAAGGVGCLCIYDFFLKQDIKADANIQKGLKWLEDNFTLTENPKAEDRQMYQYYFLYAMERAGILAETEFLGKNEWYPEGVDYLLEKQMENGSWKNDAIDTCFGILFLRRSTKPLIKVKITGEKR